jgi:hypothetical protein
MDAYMPMDAYVPIAEHGLIGDLHTVAACTGWLTGSATCRPWARSRA